VVLAFYAFCYSMSATCLLLVVDYFIRYDLPWLSAGEMLHVATIRARRVHIVAD